MSEENTTESKAPIAPDQSFPDPEEGELSEDDLEATAGGFSGICVQQSMPGAPIPEVFSKNPVSPHFDGP